MGFVLGLGNGIVFRQGGSQNWSSYWATREPSGIAVTITGASTATVTWTDSVVLGADGYKIYADATLKGTIAVGTQTADITGLTADTTYVFKVVAYKGMNESAGVSVTRTTNELWYLAGGVAAANCKGAYQPIGSASLATSYINLINPGINDAVPVEAPDWDAVNGWKFNGTSQYLTTGIVPKNDQSWSMIIRYSEYTTGDDCLAGIYETSTKQFRISINSIANDYYFGNGSDKNGGTPTANGILAVAGNKAYVNGADSGLSIVPGSGSITYDIWIGQIHYSSPANFFDGNIQAIAIYDKVLSADEVYAITTKMSALGTDDAEIRESYVKQGFGSLVCFALSTFTEKEDYVDDANLPVDTFAPTDLDIDQWLDACVDAGMTYSILTAKAHVGFCLWPTSFFVMGSDPYSIAQTVWYSANGGPDIVQLFVNGCRSRGLGVGLYFSIYDKTWEARTGTDETSDAPAYIAMIETQLAELLTNYGAIDCIWIDGWGWVMGYEEIAYATIYNYIKSIQPDCLVIENSHTHPTITSQIEIYEHHTDGHIAAGNLRLSEEVNTIRNDVHWYYHPLHGQTATSLQTAASLNTDRLQCNTRNGTYLLGITPGTDGHLPDAQVTVLKAIGDL